MVAIDTPTTPLRCDHRVQHYHGTLIAYQKDACRCSHCRKAYSRYQRARYIPQSEREPRETRLGPLWRAGSPEWLAHYAGRAERSCQVVV